MTADVLSQKATEEIKRLKVENELLSGIVRDDPAVWTFDTLLYIGRRLLAEIYPADIFNGSSGDSGPEYVVALRNAIDRIDRDRFIRASSP